MLENYFYTTQGFDTNDKQKREVAVAAALELARSSAASTTQRAHPNKVAEDLKYASENIELLADAIEQALKK
ncbi:hypothetical protein LMA04_18575 [Pseudescherichia vulneris]|uniref:hypothetical protein n=1 Tax=Pseudescherichia vulneris TaxID=566 RepID=UPI00227D31FA|nr:hypothetical protein [Pseudescherichia vulneris]WAH52069.1 hypothetical protein LMA04_18575 [Pseudescherichia vulneris]